MTRAILLAAGLGTRLRPLTNTVPKCLVSINGKPLLESWLGALANASIGPFLVNTHYLVEQVEAYVQKSRYRKQITLVNEPELLGTAGTLIANLDFFKGEDGLLIHADNYCLADFSAFARAHNQRPSGCLMTMMTFRSNDPSSCGIVELDERGVVIKFHEKVKSPPSNLANGAIYFLSKELLRIVGLEMCTAKDFSTEVLPYFLGRIYTYQTYETFVDIGTPETYRRVQEAS